MISVRRTTPSDGDAIAALRDAARLETYAKRGGPDFTSTELDAAAPSVDTHHAAVFAGCVDNVVLGVATLQKQGTRALLGELFVRAEARGVGIGHSMLTEVLNQARAWECSAIDSYALPGDRETKNFFESHAMKSRLLVVSHDLEGPG